MSERKLASVRRIAAIDPIEGADQIVCVTVDGWKLVSNKENGFKVGDLVIYFEIDSFLPCIPEFEWMRARCYKKTENLGEGFLVRTIKLRGQVSQGLIVPISDFDSYFDEFEGRKGILEYIWGGHERDSSNDREVFHPIEEGLDLTDVIGVKKFEKPIPAELSGKVRGNFPSFIFKTDQERIQNNFGRIKNWIFFGKNEVEPVIDELLIEQFEQFNSSVIPGAQCTYFKNGNLWFKKTPVKNDEDTIAERSLYEVTLKLDGSSMTVYHKDGQIGVCSRNMDLTRDPGNSFWAVALKSGVFHWLIEDGRNLAIQGELMGPGIQGNREALGNLKMFVFDVFDIDKQERWAPGVRRLWMDNFLKSPYIDDGFIDHVPFVTDYCITEETTVETLLELADTTPSLNNKVAEGIVFKNYVGGDSFKVISNKFLLKEKD